MVFAMTKRQEQRKHSEDVAPRNINSGETMENDEINRDKRGGDAYRLPFGKYKSQNLSVVPTAYLRWLVTQDWLSDHCRFEVMDELSRRGAQFTDAVMQIVSLKAEIHRLRQQLDEAERRQSSSDLEVGAADDEFAAALKAIAGAG
jgi:hypothetical protein